MTSFTYFVTQSYLNNNQIIPQCTIPRRVLHLFTQPLNTFSVLSPGLSSDTLIHILFRHYQKAYIVRERLNYL